MKSSRKFNALLAVESVLLAAVIAGIALLEPVRARDLWLYELLGAVSASMITTYGIYRMKVLT